MPAWAIYGIAANVIPKASATAGRMVKVILIGFMRKYPLEGKWAGVASSIGSAFELSDLNQYAKKLVD
jgi:hypothetical protein